MAADPIVYCLENLTDYAEFERMCNDLMVLEGFQGLEPLGGFKDKGRDAVHVSQDGQSRKSVFAYSVREDWRVKLDEDSEKVKKHNHACDRFVFLTTSHFGAGERDAAIAHIKATYGWDLELYGIERLRLLLASPHRHVVAAHPHIFSPPFFPQAGGLSLTESRDHVVIDGHAGEEALATWLARRLQLVGYLVWCRALAPVGGSSLNDTIEALIKSRASQYIPILSQAAIQDSELISRRGLAASFLNGGVLPILASPTDNTTLDAKTKSLEAVDFIGSWAKGLTNVLDVLRTRNCPRATVDSTVVLRSFVPPDTIANEPEEVYSNRFEVLHVPSVVRGFNPAKPFTKDHARKYGRQWAVRRIDDNRLYSFCDPPDDLKKEFGLRELGGAAWSSVKDVEGVRSDYLVSELIRRTLEVHCVSLGLAVCSEKGSIYFPENLCKSDRLYFERPDGSKPFVAVYGRRKLYRPTGSSYYRYHLAPTFSVKQMPSGQFAVIVRVRVRLTDDSGSLFPGRAGLSRRKHLCASWFNDEWVNRTFAVMQFAAAGHETIQFEAGSAETFDVSKSPCHWTVPVRLKEDAIAQARQAREEVLAVSRDDDSVEGEESVDE